MGHVDSSWAGSKRRSLLLLLCGAACLSSLAMAKQGADGVADAAAQPGTRKAGAPGAEPRLVLDYAQPQELIDKASGAAVPYFPYEGSGRKPPKGSPFPRPKWTLFKRARLWQEGNGHLKLQLQMAAPIQPQPGDRFIIEAHVYKQASDPEEPSRVGIVFPIGYTYGSTPPLASRHAGLMVFDHKKQQYPLIGRGQAQLSGDTLSISFDASLTGVPSSMTVVTRYLPRAIAFNQVPGDVREGAIQLMQVPPPAQPMQYPMPLHPFENTP